MGTTWSARFVASPRQDTAPVTAALKAELAAVVTDMSNWEAGSAVSRFNRLPAGRWMTLPPALFHVVQAGMAVARESDGAFDHTAGALVDLWGFGPAPAAATPPSAEAIDAARAVSGWREVRLDPHARRAFQPGGRRIDLSGIAKGHAVDRLAIRLGELGHPHALVEIGGELRGHGVKPDGQPWWIALEQPPAAALPPIRVALHGLSVATSGDYRRFFDRDGHRYSHSIDARTGRPAANRVASVTVLHRDCMSADAWATALLVAGATDGMRLAREHDLPAHWIIREADGFTERLSPALIGMIDDD